MPKNLWLDDEENKTLRSKRANGGIILADHQPGVPVSSPAFDSGGNRSDNQATSL